MAVAVAIGSIVTTDPAAGLDATRSRLIVEGTLTLSSTYGDVGGHGDVVNFESAQVGSSLPPAWVEIREDQGAGNAPLGYVFVYATGTNQSNGKLMVLNQATAAAKTGMVEFTQGDAYSTGTPTLDAAVLRFRAAFVKNI